MREEWIEIKGGTAALKLRSESESERELHPVERALLEATLREPARRDKELRIQIEKAVCPCREFTGYGAFMVIACPPNCQPSKFKGRVAGGATLNWRDSAKAPLASVAFLTAGLLDLLEIYPSDAEGWTVEACRAILSSSPDAIEICTAVNRDAIGPGWASTG